MKFLKIEVLGDVIIYLAVAGLGLAKTEDDTNIRKMKGYTDFAKHLFTNATLNTTSSKQDLKKKCVLCNERHLRSECFLARKMSFTQK